MLDNEEEFTSLVYTVSEIIKSEKLDELNDLVQNSQFTIKQTDYDNWNGGIYGYTVYMTIDVHTFTKIKNPEKIETVLCEKFDLATRHLDDENIHRVSIVPKTYSINKIAPNPHRQFSALELKRRNELIGYLNRISEDELIAEILLPLFRQLGFYRITSAEHKDKALEYGKDIWMKYTLPTQHILYFGIQVKKGKLDSSGVSKNSNANIAEIHNQLLMMLGHEIFDPEIAKRVLVDHAFIVAGGEITKAARNWLGGKLDASKRSQIMFMDREDILNLYIVTSMPLPVGAVPPPQTTDDLPF